MFLVSLDYQLNQMVTHDVSFGEVDELDPVDSGNYSLGFDES